MTPDNLTTGDLAMPFEGPLREHEQGAEGP